MRPSVQFNAVCRYGSSLGACRWNSRRQKGSWGEGRSVGIKRRMASTHGIVSISTTTFRGNIGRSDYRDQPCAVLQVSFKELPAKPCDTMALTPWQQIFCSETQFRGVPVLSRSWHSYRGGRIDNDLLTSSQFGKAAEKCQRHQTLYRLFHLVLMKLS